MRVSVTNQPPVEATGVTGDEIDLFQRYIGDTRRFPFEHQARAFQIIREGKECVLVAGTAAGKTLSVVIPLLLRVQKGLSRKILFLYPALALLEDQLQTIRRVAQSIGYENAIGHIYGGMTRRELTEQLTKPILVATPDAIYWFVEKNTKYGPLFLYSLCQVDDIVIDEAHILSGLMGENLKAFLDRLNVLRTQFLHKKRIRVHVLTATPTEVVDKLSKGEKVYGRSKVGEVIFEAELLSKGNTESWLQLIQREANGDFRRMIVVVNSAKRAHQLFFACKEEQQNSKRIMPFLRQFGWIRLQDVGRVLYTQYPHLLSTVEGWMREQTEHILIPLQNLYDDDNLLVSAGTLSEWGESWTERWKKRISSEIKEFFQKESKRKLEYTLNGKWRNHQALMRFGRLTYQDYQRTIDQYAEHLIRAWEANIHTLVEESDEAVLTKRGLQEFFRTLSLDPLFHGIADDLKNDVFRQRIPLRHVNTPFEKLLTLPLPSIPIREVEEVCIKLGISFESVFQACMKQIQLKYIGFLQGTDIPVILYTGSMTKRARNGLIEAFQSDEIRQAILISTSAVEVGVDFDADLLLSEECTSNSFLQRFGRVGRRGGNFQRVVLLTQDGGLYGKFRRAFENKDRLTREEFSEEIRSLLPERKHLNSSPYIHLLHSHVTRRLGEVGRLIAPDQPEVERLLLEKCGFRYGLRSTLPQVELLDEGIGKDPFQILSYIPKEQLRTHYDSFTVAKADVFFDQLIYMKRMYRILINQDATLKQMKVMLYWHKGQLHGIDPTILMQAATRGQPCFYQNTVHAVLNRPNALKLALSETHMAKFTQVYPYLQAIQENPKLNRYILGIGDIILQRGSGHDLHDLIDQEDDPIILRNQMFLYCPYEAGRDSKDTISWEGFEQELLVFRNEDYPEFNQPFGHILIDRVAGACVEMYRRMVETA
ncbi:DEAD/DEAH box helicase [Collibacillus ludicampi]|uniref:DEAD/DEAH box helicase n=1 Tax=Collibacillus ludicampi TaxID=2771369 RepID=UPI002494B5C3|nr:DEAD/DEAH box helicase [Collibacillus ludicampi]